jgi:PAS domain S-box-containing protein
MLKSRTDVVEQSITPLPTHILDQVSDAIIIYDLDFRYLYLNKSAAKFISKKPEYLIGKIAWEVFPETRHTESGQKFLEAARTGKNIFFITFFPPLQKWFDVRIYPGKDTIITSFRDITHEKQLDQRKDDFINLASHELKTPLTSIQIITQLLLKQSTNSGKEMPLMRKLNSQVTKMTALVNDLLSLKKIQQGRLTMHYEVFLIRTVIEDVIEDLQLTTNHKIVMSWHTRAYVNADKQRLRQIVTNFITNASKFSQAGTKIIISSQRKENIIIVKVQDFGIGIPKSEQLHIFDRYYQANGDIAVGMGLGLFIAKEVITQMGGQIWLKSDVGKGSSFYFSLPIYKVSE